MESLLHDHNTFKQSETKKSTKDTEKSSDFDSGSLWARNFVRFLNVHLLQYSL